MPIPDIGITDSLVAIASGGIETTATLSFWLTNLPPLSINETFSGNVSAAVGAPVNSILISDRATLTAGLHIDGLSVVQNINSGAGAGSRNAIFGALGQAAALPSSAFFTGIFGYCNTTSGNNGTLGAESGQYYGLGAVCEIFAGGAHLLGVKGAEIDTSIKSGATTKYHSTLSLVLVNNHAVRGGSFDAALSMTRDGTSTGTWAGGIIFGDIFGQWPFATDSTLIGASGSGKVANAGIDFTGITFTSASLSMPGGMSVNPAGIVTTPEIFTPLWLISASSAPATPSAGTWVFYVDASNNLNVKGSSGTVNLIKALTP